VNIDLSFSKVIKFNYKIIHRVETCNNVLWCCFRNQEKKRSQPPAGGESKQGTGAAGERGEAEGPRAPGWGGRRVGFSWVCPSSPRAEGRGYEGWAPGGEVGPVPRGEVWRRGTEPRGCPQPADPHAAGVPGPPARLCPRAWLRGDRARNGAGAAAGRGLSRLPKAQVKKGRRWCLGVWESFACARLGARGAPGRELALSEAEGGARGV